MNMSEILASKIGSSVSDGKLAVSFKKTVCIRQYETEVIEASMEVPVTQEDIEKRLPLIEAITLAKLEYGVLFQLYASKLITQGEYEDRKKQLEAAVTTQENYVGQNFGLSKQ